MNNIDWYYLKRPLIFFVAAILLASGLAAAGYFYEMEKLDSYKQSISTLRSTHNLYSNMVNDLDLLEQYRNKFSEYKSSGLVGEERRLSWIESLQSTNQVLKLPTLTYNLLPQEDFKRPGFKQERNVDVNSSPMELTMGLLHEEDLFAILEGLRLSISNLFTVDSCSITRLSGVDTSWDTGKENMRSECVLRWVTIDAK